MTEIGAYAFYECEGPTAVTIPVNVKSIGEGAFAWCSNLARAVIINPSVNLNWGTFGYCDKNLVLCGLTGSTAQRYADENKDVAFEALSGAEYLPLLFSGSGTQSNPWQIRDANDWNNVAFFINDGTLGTGAHYLLKNDISVDSMLGSAEHPFTGVFDGGKHTLTVDLSSEESFCAPFSVISGATIKNLVVTGSVNGGMHCSGLVGLVQGGSAITNCYVGVDVETNQSHCGGIIGHGGTSGVTITGCVFDGFINGAQHAGTIWGWSDSGAAPRLTDCLDASNSNYPIGLGFNDPANDVVNTYYTWWSDEDKPTGSSRPWSNRGKRAIFVYADEGVTMRFGESTTYDVSGITAFPTGQLFNGYFYAGEGERVILTLSATAPTGMTVKGFEASAGTLVQENGVWMLTLPGEDVSISALCGVPVVTLVTSEGETECAELMASSTEWTTGWYAVTADMKIDDRVMVQGDVKLFLCEGATLTCAKGISVYSNQGLTIEGGGTLIADASSVAQAAGIGGNFADGGMRSSGVITINGGTVTATGGQYGAGIGGGMYGFCAPVTVNAGTVTATGGLRGAGIGGGGNYYWAGNYGNTGTLTINGGVVTATGGGTGAGIGGGGGDNSASSVKGGSVEAVIINGGKVYASSSEGPGLGPARYSATGNVVLSWTNEDDRIEFSSCTGTVSFQKYRALVLEGTHTVAAASNIGGSRQVLVPCFFRIENPDFVLPASLTAVDEEAFEGVAAQTVLISDSCASIGDHAFRNCPNLWQIHIPADCALGEDVFSGCEQVFVYGTAGSPADTYCDSYENCVFMDEALY